MAHDSQPAQVGSMEELGPLPEPAMKGGPGSLTRRDYFSADQMRAYAAQERATERERCAMEVWYTMQEATAVDADDRGLEGWMREAEQRIRNRA